MGRTSIYQEMAANRKLQLTSFTLFLFFSFVSLTSHCQVKYGGKIETGFLKYRYQLVQYDLDPGSDWKGYYLDNEQDGIDLNLVNGVSFFEKRFFTGVGLGYQNFEGINGITVFGDIEYMPLKSKLTPLLNIKVGYDHIWNQYEGGTGTAFGEFAAGVSYKLNSATSHYRIEPTVL